jgi:hypothetical protein
MGVSVGVESDDGLRQRAAPGGLGDPRRTQSTFRSIWRQEKTVAAMLASIFAREPPDAAAHAMAPERLGQRSNERDHGPSVVWQRPIDELTPFSRPGRKIALAMHNDIVHTARVRQILIIFD